MNRAIIVGLLSWCGLLASASCLAAPTTSAVQDFILQLPKAELHVHLEGTIEPEDYLALVARNNITSAYADGAAVRERLAYQQDLNTFIEVYEELASVLVTAEDFEQAVLRYSSRVAKQGVLHVEMFFDPQMHTSRGIPLEEVMRGLIKAQDQVLAKYGLTLTYIACFNRDRSAESAMQHLVQLESYQEHIVAIGLDNPEVIDFPNKFAEVFAEAKEMGFKLTTHLDVNVPNTLSHHRDALNLLKVERIDHGLNVIDDPALVAAVKVAGIGLTGCVTLLYRDIPGRLEDRFGRMKRLLDAGVEISLHSDDPGLMRELYVGDLYLLGYEEGGLALDELITLATNGFKTAWISEAQRETLIARLNDYVADLRPDL